MGNVIELIQDYFKDHAQIKSLEKQFKIIREYFPEIAEKRRVELDISKPTITDTPKQSKATTVGAVATTLAFFKYLLNSPVSQTAKIIGKPGVVGICIGEFTIIYGTMRFAIENTKTGKKMDLAMEGFFAKWFWAKYYELKNNLR